MSSAASSRPPLIGITADSSEFEASGSAASQELLFLLPHRYCQAIQSAGGLPIIIPNSPSRTQIRCLLQRIDGLLVSGGNFDIHPRYFDEQPLDKLGNIKSARTYSELESIDIALRQDLPILGICGGAQAINVALGGSLYQDIATQLPNAQQHQQPARKHCGGHLIELQPGTLLHRILKRRTLEVNTTHHQAIRKLGKGLVINATAPDGLVEGIESTDHAFVLGVQWHPEVLARKILLQRKIFSSFISACQRLPRGI